MRNTVRFSALMLVLAGVVGCGDDDGTPPPDAGTGDAGPGDAGRPDSGPAGDGNDSFADADPLTPGTTATGAIATAGDEDYFSFSGTAGQWVWITTTANPDDTEGALDTVITLYDASMTQIAENDDALPRASTDSELITRLPADGTYYLRVQEYSSWAGDPPVGMSSFTYELDLAALAGGGAITVDAEGGDDVASAQALGFTPVTGADIGILVGTSNDGTDVDVYSFTIVDSRPQAQFTIMPAGTDGYGSTGQPTSLWVTNAAGDEIVARISTTTLAELSPSLPPGDYRLWVGSPASTGTNAFYVIKPYKLGDNPAETADLTNGLIATPEALTLSPLDGVPDTDAGYVLARLGADDTDHFSFEVAAGDVVSVFCGSRPSGSGVQGLTATVLSADGLTTVGTSTETATTGVEIEEATVAAAGTYVLRLTKTGQDPAVTGDWVRCGVVVGPPAAP